MNFHKVYKVNYCRYCKFWQTWKLLSFYRTKDIFWPDFADIKHGYTQEFYWSYSSFISQYPRTGKFHCLLQFKVPNTTDNIVQLISIRKVSLKSYSHVTTISEVLQDCVQTGITEFLYPTGMKNRNIHRNLDKHLCPHTKNNNWWEENWYFKFQIYYIK